VPDQLLVTAGTIFSPASNR